MLRGAHVQTLTRRDAPKSPEFPITRKPSNRKWEKEKMGIIRQQFQEPQKIGDKMFKKSIFIEIF